MNPTNTKNNLKRKNNKFPNSVTIGIPRKTITLATITLCREVAHCIFQGTGLTTKMHDIVVPSDSNPSRKACEGCLLQ